MLHLISSLNGGGLTRDAKILERTLRPFGSAVTNTAKFDWKIWVRHLAKYQLSREPPFRANIHLEHVQSRWLLTSRHNFLIPNQEWTNYQDLRNIDLVLCKTRHAHEIFRQLQIPSEYVSFTSEDHLWGSPVWERPINMVLHIAGGSSQKGTKEITDIWCRHPEWPELVVVHRMLYPDWQDALHEPVAPNIRYISNWIPDEEVIKLQNSAGIHVCPSEAEGWGHAIVEGLSCGALVITTDGAPMNEIVAPERGLLVKVQRRVKKNLGVAHFVDSRDIERVCDQAISMSCCERRSYGQAARAWYLQNHSTWVKNLKNTLRGVIEGVS